MIDAFGELSKFIVIELYRGHRVVKKGRKIYLNRGRELKQPCRDILDTVDREALC